MTKDSIPSYDSLMNPVIDALKALGGSGTIDEINDKVIELGRFNEQQLEILHDPDKGSQTEIEYRLAWARTYLKKFEVLENSSRGVWALTPKGRQLEKVDPRAVKRFVSKQKQPVEPLDETNLEEPPSAPTWRDHLIETLHKMEPSAFERLIQRMLRESGFTQVEITGRSGDGGIDGKGIIRLGGVLSFHVIFQCKKYKGSVASNQIRDFRGAMVGRADKGLFVTTGNFTKDAIREATRDGAPAIDLIDGDQLIDKLKELSLGVTTQKVVLEQVTVDSTWFASI